MSAALPPGPEDRRLKAAGMAMVAIGAGTMGVLLNRNEADALMAIIVLANVVIAGVLVTSAGCGLQRPLPGRRRWLSLLLQWLLGNALVAVTLLGGLLDDPQLESDNPEAVATSMLLSVAGYAALLIAWRFWRRSRQLEAASAAEAMALDPRPPVLYLRSFRDDGLSLAAQRGGAPKRHLLAFLRLPTPEEQAAAALARIGPVVAIGKPGEPLPELGAARLYVAHDRWQQEVLALLRRATLVVLRLGASPGVLWEVEQTLANVPRRRIVFMQFGDEPIAPEIAARLAPLLPAVAPRGAPGVGRLIYFDRIETPIAVTVEATAAMRWNVLRWLGIGAVRSPMDEAWHRVSVGLGLIPPRDTRRSRAVAVGLALALGAFGAHWFYLRRQRRGWAHVATIPLLLAPMFVGWFDGVRFLWIDRTEFAARYARGDR